MLLQLCQVHIVYIEWFIVLSSRYVLDFRSIFTFPSFGSGSKAKSFPRYTSDRPNSGCCFIPPPFVSFFGTGFFPFFLEVFPWVAQIHLGITLH